MKEAKKELIKCIIFIWGAAYMYYILVKLFV